MRYFLSVRYIASALVMSLAGFVLTRHEVHPVVQVFVFAWVISAWEWALRPSILELKRKIEQKRAKKAIDNS